MTTGDDLRRDTMRPEAAGADLPSAGHETPPEPPEAASDAEDAPRTHPGGEPEDAIQQTAPIFPAEVVLSMHGNWLQRLPGGGMQVKFAALVMTPAGPRPQLPAYVVEFNADGWERFKRVVAADGDVPSVELATHLPPGVRG